MGTVVRLKKPLKEVHIIRKKLVFSGILWYHIKDGALCAEPFFFPATEVLHD